MRNDKWQMSVSLFHRATVSLMPLSFRCIHSFASEISFTSRPQTSREESIDNTNPCINVFVKRNGVFLCIYVFLTAIDFTHYFGSYIIRVFLFSVLFTNRIQRDYIFYIYDLIIFMYCDQQKLELSLKQTRRRISNTHILSRFSIFSKVKNAFLLVVNLIIGCELQLL